MVAGGYPNQYRKGDVISGLPTKIDPDCKVFIAGAQLDNNRVLTHGGRVLCVTALGSNVAQAQQKAYSVVKQIHWPDAYYRSDIGYRAVAREQIT